MKVLFIDKKFEVTQFKKLIDKLFELRRKYKEERYDVIKFLV